MILVRHSKGGYTSPAYISTCARRREATPPSMMIDDRIIALFDLPLGNTLGPENNDIR